MRLRRKLSKYKAHKEEKFAFHGDIELKKTVILLSIATTEFIETGTYLGHSTDYIASLFPTKKIYTCEVNTEYFNKAKDNLSIYNNVNLSNLPSPTFLKGLFSKNKVNEKSLFFLDAHWELPWPLKDELSVISNSIKKAVIIIDDFKIKGLLRFGYDAYENQECCLDYIKQYLSNLNNYDILYPAYKQNQAFDHQPHGDLRGYAIIFQNMRQEFEFIYQLISKAYVFENSKIN